MLELSERLGNLKNSARGHKEQMEGAIQVHPNPTLRNAFLMIELLCGFVMEYEATTVNDAVFIQHIQADFKPDEEVIRKMCGKTAKEIIGAEGDKKTPEPFKHPCCHEAFSVDGLADCDRISGDADEEQTKDVCRRKAEDGLGWSGCPSGELRLTGGSDG